MYNFRMHQTLVIGFCLRLQRPLNFKLLPNYRFCSTGHVCQVKKPQNTKGSHIPVMLNEILTILNPKEGQVILDMTFGSGGHSREILRTAPQLKQLIVLDRDPLAHEIALDFADEFRHCKILPLLGTFEDLPHLLQQHQVPTNSIHSVLLDAGASSMQYSAANRGFSLSLNGNLDMRMNELREADQPTAADVVNTLDEKSLQELIKKYGEEKKAHDIAHAIVQFRAAFGKIVTTHQLVAIVASVFDSPMKLDKLQRPAHVATKTFQALRIFVNNELNQLSNGLLVAHSYLKEEGVCAAISFHSLEDRIVKRHFHGIDINASKNMSLSSHQFLSPSKIYNEASVQGIISKKWNPIQKKVIVPDPTEVKRNPRARSAKLRAAIKCSS
ncbi:probable methyltransferase-like protein 15 homolog isoform X1 [Octopus sinensis]|uniref:Probable methyltransferase-like protein 15 homolog isoform X1 n=1 Tax=Octopus sinensis TaxID=2607531 RepID=A0A6P7SDL8_9MOLL|nr:probable methyltransferase-like protein 15 homolog isoform X1 [Octopus sinensis]